VIPGGFGLGRLISRLSLTILWPLTATRKEEFLCPIIAPPFALRVLSSRQIPYLTTGRLKVCRASTNWRNINPAMDLFRETLTLNKKLKPAMRHLPQPVASGASPICRLCWSARSLHASMQRTLELYLASPPSCIT
jgi:hypothetical protein